MIDMFLYRERKVTQGHTSSRGIVVNPEGDPGQDCDQGGGHVRLQDKVAYVSLDAETQRQPRVWTWGDTSTQQKPKKRDVNMQVETQKRNHREKQIYNLQLSKPALWQRIVIFPFVQMEHLISPKQWIPSQGLVPFQLNMAESRKHGRFFWNPFSAGSIYVPLRIVTKACSVSFFLFRSLIQGIWERTKWNYVTEEHVPLMCKLWWTV